MRKCFICGRTDWLERHHIFGGANRKLSEEDGLVVDLCHFCHNEPPNGVHYNRKQMDWLRAEGQKMYEQNHSREEFMARYGRNYL
jgi:hypothetical protein